MLTLLQPGLSSQPVLARSASAPYLAAEAAVEEEHSKDHSLRRQLRPVVAVAGLHLEVVVPP